ncbi:MAG TPA: iron ABC transporter permease [Longimicrobiales bacterium]|nr:iron ABC transporter permease [Longimicrobiales bacterium]
MRASGQDHEGFARANVVAALVIALLVWLVLYPNLYVLGDSLRVGSELTLEHYRSFVDSRSEREALWNSVWISAASVFFSALVGVPLAFLFSRYDFPGRMVLGGLVALPVLLPPLVGVIAFLFLYGESGFVARIVQGVLGLERPPWRLSGPWAILLVHSYTMYVYFFLFTSAGLSRLDTAYAEAAAALGASRLTTIRRVTIPMLGPALAGAGLLVFMTSMGSFSAPYVFGGGFRVLTTQIFVSKLNGDLGIAAVETVILAAVSIVFLAMVQRYEARRAYTGSAKGTVAPAAAPVRGRFGRYGLTLLSSALVLFLLLPHLTVLVVSFVPEGTWTTQLFPPVYSGRNYVALFTESEQLVPIMNSLQMATIATFANVVLAFLAAYLLVRRNVRGKTALGALVVLPWALPGTVLAIALATTFSVNQPLTGRFLLVGTFAMLPLAYFIRNIPLVTRAALASFKQFDPALEEASASLGASWTLTMRRVALPLVLPGLVAGALLAFVTALGEFVASILLYTHRTRPISMAILSELRAFDFGGAAAYGVLLIVLMAVVFMLGYRNVSTGPGL